MNSEDALKLLQQQKIATNFQLSQSNCLLRTHVARGLEGEGWKMKHNHHIVSSATTTHQLEEVLVITDDRTVGRSHKACRGKRCRQRYWTGSEIQYLEWHQVIAKHTGVV